jgi:DNA polymerase I-like protein with 3'-5' exonuclease and polymerase domains
MAKTKSKTTVIDAETYYDKDCSIILEGAYAYCRHPMWDCYMISLVNDDFEWVGHPNDAPWDRIKGHTLVAHNAAFDQVVFERLVELGIVPQKIADSIAGWECTADLAVYCHFQRNLAGAVKYALDTEMDKTMRNWMKGRTWEDAIAEGKAKELLQYCLDDSKLCWQFYKNYREEWPENEVKLSLHTREMGFKGLPVDEPYLLEGIDKLEKHMFELRSLLPWYEEIDPDTKKPYVIYSKKALAIECRKKDIDPPKSLAKDDPDLAKWMRLHGDEFPFVAHMQNYQRMNTQLKRLRTFQRRLRPDGTIPYNLKYFGGHTGRWSGDAGNNIQNMPRAPMYGVDVRSLIKAPEGMVWSIVDFTSIEPYTTAYLLDDHDTLAYLEDGVNIYEAHARATMGWTGGKLKTEDPQMYMLAKVRVLALGYGAGWFRFLETVKSFGMVDVLDRPYSRSDAMRFQSFNEKYHPAKAEVFPRLSAEDKRLWVNAYIQVSDFRQSNPLIQQRQREHDNLVKHCAANGEEYAFPLMSGRLLKFFNIRPELMGTSCQTLRGEKKRSYVYGPLLFENEIQANAREFLAEAILRLSDEGYDIAMHVHDEVVIAVPEENADEESEKIIEIMCRPPVWAPGFPLRAEATVSKVYTK